MWVAPLTPIDFEPSGEWHCVNDKTPHLFAKDVCWPKNYKALIMTLSSAMLVILN